MEPQYKGYLILEIVILWGPLGSYLGRWRFITYYGVVNGPFTHLPPEYAIQ